jgi:hypothetical protein
MMSNGHIYDAVKKYDFDMMIENKAPKISPNIAQSKWGRGSAPRGPYG